MLDLRLRLLPRRSASIGVENCFIMYDSDEFSFSFISTVPGETVYTPTDQGTDNFEFLDDDHGVVVYQSDARSSASTSVTPSACSYEFEHGRRYHSFKSGRYPLPNDAGEQHREETRHALMLELTVSIQLIHLKKPSALILTTSRRVSSSCPK